MHHPTKSMELMTDTMLVCSITRWVVADALVRKRKGVSQDIPE